MYGFIEKTLTLISPQDNAGTVGTFQMITPIRREEFWTSLFFAVCQVIKDLPLQQRLTYRTTASAQTLPPPAIYVSPTHLPHLLQYPGLPGYDLDLP